MPLGLGGALAENVARVVAERVTSAGLSAMVSTFKRARASLKDEEKNGASDAERRAAYDEFRDAVVRHRVTLGVLATGTPTPLGALWTYPVHLRLLNGCPNEAAQLIQAFLSVEMNGRHEACAAAEQALAAVVSAAAAFGPERRGERATRERKINAELAVVDEAIARFTLVARRDLGYD